MRFVLFFLTCFSAWFSVVAQEAVAPETLNVLCFNLRYNNPADGRNAWPNRKELAAKVFTDHAVDFAGLQEALAGQIDDLQKLLPDFAWTGVGRDDGQTKGEYAPIFYRKDRFALEKKGTFWLSETPDVVGSKSWDAALPRIATWGVFRDVNSGHELFVINTHFDHRGKEARRQSAKLLIERIVALSGKLPVILTGDFNSAESSSAIQTLTADERLKLTNSERISKEPHVGGAVSFNGFGKEESEDKVIDFVLVGPGVEVKSHGFFRIVEDGLYVSDHWPVVSQLVVL